MYKAAFIRFFLLISSLFQCGIKVRGASHILAIFVTKISVFLIQISGLCLIAFIYFTTLIDEIPKLVIAFPIRANCI